MQGFEIRGSIDLLITDRLHRHVVSATVGVPHIHMDSKPNSLNFHDTWAEDGRRRQLRRGQTLCAVVL